MGTLESTGGWDESVGVTEESNPVDEESTVPPLLLEPLSSHAAIITMPVAALAIPAAKTPILRMGTTLSERNRRISIREAAIATFDDEMASLWRCARSPFPP
jgi:hypothetical protein